jgi:hypothetical protein
MGSRVGTPVGVLAGVGGKVSNAVTVNVNVEAEVGIAVEALVTWAGTIWIWGVQALLSKNRIRRMAVMSLMDIPPGDEVICCLNGKLDSVVPKIIQPPTFADG